MRCVKVCYKVSPWGEYREKMEDASTCIEMDDSLAEDFLHKASRSEMKALEKTLQLLESLKLQMYVFGSICSIREVNKQ